MTQPYFTICLPTYNCAETLGAAIDRVIRQTEPDWELLVIDDGSTDKSRAVVEAIQRDYAGARIGYHFKDNGGKYTAINAGLDLARGKYFIILDSDDLLLPDAPQQIKALLDQLPWARGVIGQCQDQNGRVLGSRFPEGKTRIDYFDFHFGSGFSLHGNRYVDCCDCNLTVDLKAYRIPEAADIKFMPEAYLFDQLGADHQLIATNVVLRQTTYRADGISASYGTGFDQKHYAAFLQKVILNETAIFPQHHVRLMPRLVNWLNYWRYKRYDVDNRYQMPHVTLLGWLMKPVIPVALKLKAKQ